jgi:nitric oxide reductase NorE protein
VNSHVHAETSPPQEVSRLKPADNSATSRHVPGEPGLWVLIFGDLVLFGALFTTFLVYRGHSPALFTRSQRALDVDLGVVNTLLLLASSLFVAIGVRGVRRRNRQLAPWMFTVALCCGAGFGFDKYLEYSDKVEHGITPATDTFYMFYYVLTGLHMLHVLLGMGVLAFLAAQARSTHIDVRRFAYIEGGACFWHLVDLLWIVLFPLLYLVRS